MTYSIDIRQVPAMQLAIVRGPTKATNLPSRIRALFDKFYAGFKSRGELNVVFYPEWNATGEFEIECGVLVKSGGNSSTPAGIVATTAHFGPYEQLSGAHNAIHHWVKDNGRKLAGPSWEVYGHWNDDPAKLQTDIFYLLV